MSQYFGLEVTQAISRAADNAVATASAAATARRVGIADRDEKIDAIERKILASMPLVDQPLMHKFAGDHYIRSVINPKDSLVTTKIHRTAHPFFVLRGVALVSQDDGPPIQIQAPYSGITYPGTRRVILAIEEVEWVTVHAMTPEERDEPHIPTRLGMIEARLIEPRELIDGKSSHQLFWEKYEQQQQVQGQGPGPGQQQPPRELGEGEGQ